MLAMLVMNGGHCNPKRIVTEANGLGPTRSYSSATIRKRRCSGLGYVRTRKGLLASIDGICNCSWNVHQAMAPGHVNPSVVSRMARQKAPLRSCEMDALHGAERADVATVRSYPASGGVPALG